MKVFCPLADRIQAGRANPTMTTGIKILGGWLLFSTPKEAGDFWDAAAASGMIPTGADRHELITPLPPAAVNHANV